MEASSDLLHYTRDEIFQWLQKLCYSAPDSLCPKVYDYYIGPRRDEGCLRGMGPFRTDGGQVEYVPVPIGLGKDPQMLAITELFGAIGYVLSYLGKPANRAERLLLLLVYAYICGVITLDGHRPPVRADMLWLESSSSLLLLFPVLDESDEANARDLAEISPLPPDPAPVRPFELCIYNGCPPAISWKMHKNSVRLMRETSQATDFAEELDHLRKQFPVLTRLPYYHCPETIHCLQFAKERSLLNDESPMLVRSLAPAEITRVAKGLNRLETPLQADQFLKDNKQFWRRRRGTHVS